MKTLQVEISADMAEKLNTVTAKSMPYTKQAFNAIVYGIEKQWKDWSTGNTIPGVINNPFPSTRLRQSIHSQFNADFDATIVSNNPQMDRIERGTPSFDMKEKYPYGKKSRVARNPDGSVKSYYLIIPFRWGTPNDKGTDRAHFKGRTIPNYLYETVKKLDSSRRTSDTHTEKNARGEDIQRSEYEWGNRLGKNDTDIPEAVGMVKMSGRSGYFTFRIISTRSAKDKWIRSEIPPIPITDALIHENQEYAQKLIDEAVAKDIENL